MGIAPALEGITRRRPARQLPAVAEIADGFRRHEVLVRASAIAFRTLASTRRKITL